MCVKEQDRLKQSGSPVVGVSWLQSVCCGLTCRIGSHLAILSQIGEGEKGRERVTEETLTH